MSKKNPKALVLTGFGINCDYETEEACRLAGFIADRMHLNDVLLMRSRLQDYKLVVFPGGFSFGDDLGAGVAFAATIRYSRVSRGRSLYEALMEYVKDGGLVLGICNGFQILVRLGMIPAVNHSYGSQQVTLAPNEKGFYIDRWVRLLIEEGSPNVFTKGLRTLKIPVRHGEGRFITTDSTVSQLIEKGHHVALRYCDEKGKPTQAFPMNPNGSENAVAGVCDPSGRIFGLMPHPEAAVSIYQYPDWQRQREDCMRKGSDFSETGDGYYIFKNAFDWNG